MPAPVVLAHIAERGTDATLCRHRMAASREYFRDAGSLETRFCESKGRAQSGATRADNNDVVSVINKFVVAHAPNPILIIP